MKYNVTLNEKEKLYLPLELSRNLYEAGYGFVGDNYLYLEPYEALYLLYKNKASIIKDGKPLSFEEAFKILSKNTSKLWERFVVYMHLREKNYIVRKGYGEDYDFLLYDKGSNYKEAYAKYIVTILREGLSISIGKLDEMLDFARRMRKELIIAIIDGNGDVSFYKASKVKII
jgi:tRNA intron endonuclease